MANYRLVVRMKGPTADDGDVWLDDFLSFLIDLQSTLHATDRAVARTDAPTSRYRVRDLSHSSPATVVLYAEKRAAEVDLRDLVLNTFVSGINDIQAGTTPRGFNSNLLLNYQDLAKHLTGRLQEASFSHGKTKARVSSSFWDQIERIVGPDRKEHGAISGTLDIVNVHQHRSFFWLYPAGGQPRVKCYFPVGLIAAVGQGIRRYVTVSGTLRFKATMLQPHSVSVAAIDIHEDDADLPDLRSLRGIVRDASVNRETSEQYVRRLRDGW